MSNITIMSYPRGYLPQNNTSNLKKERRIILDKKKRKYKKMRNTVADKMIFSLKHLIQLQGSL